MDQAPAALSHILESALNEIREELNELKQSNTALLKKNEALEAAQKESRSAIEQLQVALKETRTDYEGLESKEKECRELIGQLDGALKETRAELEAQFEVQFESVNEQRVALAQVQNENAALKELLMALSEGQSVVTDTQEHEESPRHREPAIGAAEMELDRAQQPPALSIESPIRQPFVRELSVASSMTFCNTEHSHDNRKRRALGLLDKVTELPPELQVSLHKPDESAIQQLSNKRLKTATSSSQLPHRPAAGQGGNSVLSSSFVHQSSAATPDKGQYGGDEDVDMEDNIIVAPKHSRTTHPTPEKPSVLTTSASPTVSQVGRIVDDVLRDFEEGTAADSMTVNAPLSSAIAPAAQTELVPQTPTAPTSDSSNAHTSYVRDNPDIIDPDSGLSHQATNRGENDQTGVVGERRYRTIKLNGVVYTVDRSRCHANTIQDWKSWALKRNGTWYQWKSYSSLDWTDQLAVEKMNKWREQALCRAGFTPKRKEVRSDYTDEERDWLFEHVKAAGGERPNKPIPELARQFNELFDQERTEIGIQRVVDRLRGEYQKYAGQKKPLRSRRRQIQCQAQSESEKAEKDAQKEDSIMAAVGGAQAKPITRTDLLSQFKARTDEM